nr:hypothetical protein [Oscillatoriaceae cyanobacterium Prado104]
MSYYSSKTALLHFSKDFLTSSALEGSPLTLHIGRLYLFLSLSPQLLCKTPTIFTKLYIKSQNPAECEQPGRIEGGQCGESIEVLIDVPDRVACHSTLQTFFADRIECVILCYKSATQPAAPSRSRYQRFFSMPLKHGSRILRSTSEHQQQAPLAADSLRASESLRGFTACQPSRIRKLMATKNIRIVGYLPPDNYQKLRDYMAEQSLTESAALVKIIKQFFEAAPALSVETVASETRETFAQMRSEIAELRGRVAALETAGIQRQFHKTSPKNFGVQQPSMMLRPLKAADLAK